MLIEAASPAILAAISAAALLLAVLIAVSYVSPARLAVLVFLIAPEPTTRRFSAFNGWLRRNAG
jgi:hypothetical protein